MGVRVLGVLMEVVLQAPGVALKVLSGGPADASGFLGVLPPWFRNPKENRFLFCNFSGTDCPGFYILLKPFLVICFFL